MDVRNILTRAGWTALQAGLVAIAVIPGLTDATGWKEAGYAFVMAASAAGLSAIKTAILEVVEAKKAA